METLKNNPGMRMLEIKINAFANGRMAFFSIPEIINYSDRLSLSINIAYEDGVIDRGRREELHTIVDEATSNNISNFRES